MQLPVVCIVEGHGDVESAPTLFRRIAEAVDPEFVTRLQFPHPIRVSKDKLLKEGELERAVNLAGRKVRPHGCVFLVIDADTDCPAILGPTLLDRARKECGDIFIACVLAKTEWENWFIAAAGSIAGQFGLAADLRTPPEPELIRGAKEWLTRHMLPGQPYSETLHQAALTRAFDFQLARRADSFDKCYREITEATRSLIAQGERRQ